RLGFASASTICAIAPPVKPAASSAATTVATRRQVVSAGHRRVGVTGPATASQITRYTSRPYPAAVPLSCLESIGPYGRLPAMDESTDVSSAERLVFFSDAVVAIALTLLALELPVPEGGTNEVVLRQVVHLRDEYSAFLISFAVIGSHGFGHHRLFAQVTGHAGSMVRWNTLWLLMIVLTPFATRVLTAGGAFETRFIVYASVQALA